MTPPTRPVASAYRRGLAELARNPLPTLAGLAFHALALLLGVGAVSRLGAVPGGAVVLLPVMQAVLNGRQLENRLRRYDGQPAATRPSYMLPTHPVAYGLTLLASSLGALLVCFPAAMAFALVSQLGPGSEASIQSPVAATIAVVTGLTATWLLFGAYALTSFAGLLAIDRGLGAGRAIVESCRRAWPHRGALCRFVLTWGLLQGLGVLTGGIALVVTVPVGSYALIDLYRRMAAPLQPATRAMGKTA